MSVAVSAVTVEKYTNNYIFLNHRWWFDSAWGYHKKERLESVEISTFSSLLISYAVMVSYNFSLFKKGVLGRFRS